VHYVDRETGEIANKPIKQAKFLPQQAIPTAPKLRMGEKSISSLDQHFQCVSVGGASKGVVGCTDLGKLEAMRDQLLGIDLS
jgi:hypothetical protein